MNTEWVAPLLASAALGISGYVYKQASKVEDIEQDIQYIRGRVDSLYDYLLGKDD